VSWDSRLPDGVEFKGRTAEGFRIGVSMPTGEDGLSPCLCPDEPTHRFKVAITPSDAATDSTLWCPYCGLQAPTRTFMPDQMARARAAMEQVAQRYMRDSIDKMMRDAFGKPAPRRTSGISVEYRPGPRRSYRPLPTFEVEPTRRPMTCSRCDETWAVYGLATYCPVCGLLAPAQQLTTLIAVHRDRVTEMDNLDPDVLQRLVESGVVAATYESSFKDGFGALETYLKNRFFEEAPPLPKPPHPTTFQRLADTNELYKQHFGIDLEALAGPATWSALIRAAAIRHVLTHNAGVIDARFLTRMPQWHQAEGQKLVIERDETLSFLDALSAFADNVVG